MTCVLCGARGRPLYRGLQDHVFGVPGAWDLDRCPDCGLVWLSHQTPPPEHGGYRAYYTHGVESPTAPPVRRRLRRQLFHAGFEYGETKPGLVARLAVRVRPLRDLVGRTVLWLPADARGRLLDVGCGNGMFIARMKELGWEAVGLDPDPEAVEVAHRAFGVEAHVGRVENTALPEASFDAVTLSHVIEHLPDPVATLRACARLLRPGGRLIALTPNPLGLACRWFGPDWRGWEPPRHLFVFTPTALRTCADRAGLVVEDLRTTADGARFYALASRAIRHRERLEAGEAVDPPIRAIALAYAFWSIAAPLTAFGPYGDELLLLARAR